MGNIALTILADQRDRYPHRAEHGIALPGGRRIFHAMSFQPAIMGNKPATGGTQNIAGADKGVPCGMA